MISKIVQNLYPFLHCVMSPGVRHRTREGKKVLADGAEQAQSPDRPEFSAFFTVLKVLKC